MGNFETLFLDELHLAEATVASNAKSGGRVSRDRMGQGILVLFMGGHVVSVDSVDWDIPVLFVLDSPTLMIIWRLVACFDTCNLNF